MGCFQAMKNKKPENSDKKNPNEICTERTSLLTGNRLLGYIYKSSAGAKLELTGQKTSSAFAVFLRRGCTAKNDFPAEYYLF